MKNCTVFVDALSEISFCSRFSIYSVDPIIFVWCASGSS